MHRVSTHAESAIRIYQMHSHPPTTPTAPASPTATAPGTATPDAPASPTPGARHRIYLPFTSMR